MAPIVLAAVVAVNAVHTWEYSAAGAAGGGVRSLLGAPCQPLSASRTPPVSWRQWSAGTGGGGSSPGVARWRRWGKEVPSRNCRGGSTLVKLLHCCFKWLCCSLSEQEVLSCMEWFEGCSLAQCSWWWLPQCWAQDIWTYDHRMLVIPVIPLLRAA